MTTASTQESIQDFTLSSDSYNELIGYMNSLTPFEAAKQATEINQMNGFEVVSRVEIARWKKEAVKHFEKIKVTESIFEKTKVGNLKNEKSKIEILNLDSAKGSQFENEKSNFKTQKLESQYHKAYMNLLSV